MKNMFRKALTVLGSAAMIGATVGAAAAAAYPAPFTSNTAIIVGANAAPSDSIAAASIAADLNAAMVGTSVSGTKTVTGGDSYKFEKTSTKLHLGDNITAIQTSLDDDEMPLLLADGVFVDDNNDEFDYTQTITMSANQLKFFEDSDYKEDEPTIGFHFNTGDTVLTYELEFSDRPAIADMEEADLTLMGKTYYVLDAAYNTLTLLDSATDTIVAEGETVTMTAGGKTYQVSVEFVDSTSAKLKVGSETTNKLTAGQTYKLADGSYVGVKEVLYSAKDTGISKVEFSIGNGKLILTDGDEVELNEDNIDGLTATITNVTTEMSSISIAWSADDDIFVTEDSMAVMPGFESVQLAFGGLNTPDEEKIMVTNQNDDTFILDDFPLKDSTEDIAILYGNSTHLRGIGQDGTGAKLLRTDNDGNITFDGDTDQYFVASWSDGRDSESYLMRATNFGNDGTDNETTFQYKKNGVWTDAKVDAQTGDTFSVGSVELALGTINDNGESVVLWNNSASTSFNKLYSKEGLTVYLPFDSLTSSATGVINLTALPTTYSLVFDEEDKDGDLGDGPTITATLGLNADGDVSVTAYTSGGTLAGEQEIDDSDVFQNYVYSELATEIRHDEGPDQKKLTLIYHGDEVSADVYITSSDAVVSSGSSAGVMTYTDTEVSKAAGMNLVVVGGSAINSVAAELLGGAYSEAQFTSMTGVASGEFLIQSFDRAGKTALLVAGYNAADTTKAATYLVNNAVDTAVGNKYEGTSATQATLVVA